MAVYIDDAKLHYRHMRMSHMIADSTQELLAMASRIGIQWRWIQAPDTYREHFDVCQSKRELAIEDGAIPVTQRELGKMLNSRRSKRGPLDIPRRIRPKTQPSENQQSLWR